MYGSIILELYEENGISPVPTESSREINVFSNINLSPTPNPVWSSRRMSSPNVPATVVLSSCLNDPNSSIYDISRANEIMASKDVSSATLTKDSRARSVIV